MELDIAGYCVGDLTVEVRRERVLRGAEVIVLPKLSFDLLLVLIKAAPELVSTETLLDQVWTGVVVAPETVTQRVKLLRGALGDDSHSPRYIEGVRGRGYRMIAEVGVLNVGAATIGAAISSTPVTTPDAAVQTVVTKTSGRRWIGQLLLIVVLLSGVTAAFLRLPSGQPLSISQSSVSAIAQDYYLQALLAREVVVDSIANPQNMRVVEGLLNQAIALDPGFAAAYAERAMIRFALFFVNIELTQQQLDLAEADLMMANKLAPTHPKVMAANGFKLSYIDLNFVDAADVLGRSVAAGMNDPVWLGLYADVLGVIGRTQETVAVIQSAITLDYENPVLQQLYLNWLLNNSDYERAFESLAFYLQQRPDDQAMNAIYAVNVAYLTGNLQPWRELAERASPFLNVTSISPAASISRDIALHAQFEWLRIDRRYAELLQLIEQYPAATLRPVYVSAGLQPKASLAGWVQLLMGDTVAAAQSGAEITQFLAEQKVFPSHYWYRTLLAAQAALFSGDHVQAIELTDKLDRELPPYLALRGWVPVLYAWAGADAKVMEILHLVSSNEVRVVPGRLTLDPLLAVPLADNPDYLALKSRLEREMRAMQIPGNL